MRREKRGFTLLEILLVIAAIGVLVAIVLIAINPNRQLGQARNSVRQSESNSIAKAIEQYAIENGGAYPGGITGTYQDICPVGVSINCVNLSTLVPNYIAGIPLDPSGGNYQVAINPSNGKVSLRAPNTEIGASIAVNPFAPTITFAKSAGGIGVIGEAGSFELSKTTSIPDGSSIVTGYFYGEVTFAPGITLTSQGYDEDAWTQDMYIAKYNADGSVAWAKKSTNTSPNIFGVSAVYDITGYADGSSVIAGKSYDNIVFGAGDTNQVTLTNLGGGFNFLVKYDVNGNVIWAKKVSNTQYSSDPISAVSSLSDGGSIITGTFYDTVVFGAGEVNETTLTSSNSSGDIFVAKYNTGGDLVWVKKAGGDFYDNSSDISTYADGSSIVTGYFFEFTGNVTFGAGEANETTLSTAGGTDIFIAKYNADGSLAWAKRAGGIDWENPPYITSNTDGSSVIVGYFYGDIIFGGGEANETTLSSIGSNIYDIFIAKYNANGSLAWAKRAGGANSDYGIDIGGLVDGSSVVIGSFGGTAIFGQGESNQTSLVGGGGFLAKYNADGSLVWAKKSAEGEGDGVSYLNAMSSYPDGSIIATGTFCGENTFGKNNPGETLLSSFGGGDLFVAKYDFNGELTTPNTINPTNPTVSCYSGGGGDGDG
jgi:prepilin-type N-terminal cleavage/methylation domain-containing protein